MSFLWGLFDEKTPAQKYRDAVIDSLEELEGTDVRVAVTLRDNQIQYGTVHEVNSKVVSFCLPDLDHAHGFGRALWLVEVDDIASVDINFTPPIEIIRASVEATVKAARNNSRPPATRSTTAKTPPVAGSRKVAAKA